MQVMFCLSKFHLETSVKNKRDKKNNKKKLPPSRTKKENLPH